jgi:hypothetical protein
MPAGNITYTATVNDGNSSLTSTPVVITVLPLPPAPVITENGGQLVSNTATGNQWYVNNAMIPNANQQTYTPVASGDYYVIVTDAAYGCSSDPSNTIVYIYTGIGVNAAGKLVNIYPNPFRDNVTISYELPEPGITRISLSDAFGKEIRVLVNNADQDEGRYSLVMNSENLATGIYYCKVQTGTYNVVKKLMLSK